MWTDESCMRPRERGRGQTTFLVSGTATRRSRRALPGLQLDSCRDAPARPRATPVHGEFAMKVTGQCHCGKISYEAEVDPARATRSEERRVGKESRIKRQQ